METTFVWIGIFLCLSQSAMFSGLNLAFFAISRLQIEIMASDNNKNAIKVLKLRENSNFLLSTILWGNVGVNTLLALLSGSVLGGIAAFLFSTLFITVFAEVIPQAYFSRNALKIAALLSPAIRFYQVVLFPVARPTAWILDMWLGPEGVHYIKEKMLRQYIVKSMGAPDSGIGPFEGRGAINFLALDNRCVGEEGGIVNPGSIVSLDVVDGHLDFPKIVGAAADSFIQRVQASRMKWVVLTDPDGEPHLLLNANRYLRAVFMDESVDPREYCIKPIVTNDPEATLEKLIMSVGSGEAQPSVKAGPTEDGTMLLWGSEKRIVAHTDVLRRLFEGVFRSPGAPQAP